MRLNDARIESLQALLKSELGLDYNLEQTHEAGMAIIRFILAKSQRQSKATTNNMETPYDSDSTNRQ